MRTALLAMLVLTMAGCDRRDGFSSERRHVHDRPVHVRVGDGGGPRADAVRSLYARPAAWVPVPYLDRGRQGVAMLSGTGDAQRIVRSERDGYTVFLVNVSCAARGFGVVGARRAASDSALPSEPVTETFEAAFPQEIAKLCVRTGTTGRMRSVRQAAVAARVLSRLPRSAPPASGRD